MNTLDQSKPFRVLSLDGGGSYTERGLSTPDHQMVGVNFERLFERVYVGPNASEDVFQEAESLANKAAGCRVVHRSTVPAFAFSK
jgi:hypothetical protein